MDQWLLQDLTVSLPSTQRLSREDLDDGCHVDALIIVVNENEWQVAIRFLHISKEVTVGKRTYYLGELL